MTKLADAAGTRSLSDAFPSWTPEPYVHWSGHLSLYSAKTRAYMIKKGLHFVEKTPGSDPQRWQDVIQSAICYPTLPVLDLPDGTFISDSTAIIRYLEERHLKPAMQPADPVMRALAWLIFNYGTEGLFLSAQYFRWSFDDSAHFAVRDSGRLMASPDPSERAKTESQGTQFKEMKLARFASEIGITPDTIPAIEQSNRLLFEALDLHFSYHPYILGGRPCVADAALMETLHAHLGRDPYPAHLMKMTAPVLFRWTETMNRTGIQDAELPHAPQEFLDPGNLQEPLIGFLRLVCADFGAQFAAAAKAYEDWLATDLDRPEGTIISLDGTAANRQTIGRMAYDLQGVTVERDAWPDVINMHQYVLEVVDTMNPSQLALWMQLMETVGGEAFLSYRPSRPIVLQKDRPPFAFVLGPRT